MRAALRSVARWIEDYGAQSNVQVWVFVDHGHDLGFMERGTRVWTLDLFDTYLAYVRTLFLDFVKLIKYMVRSGSCGLRTCL